jgi:hypothetical protein
MEPLHVDELEPGEDITLERLAVMIGRGFAHNDKQFAAMDARFVAIESRLGRIEHLLLAEPKREIEDLKTRMKRLEDALAV